jgi:hypothetical protein
VSPNQWWRRGWWKLENLAGSAMKIGVQLNMGLHSSVLSDWFTMDNFANMHAFYVYLLAYFSVYFRFIIRRMSTKRRGGLFKDAFYSSNNQYIILLCVDC